MCHLRGIFISGTYFAIVCGISVADSCFWTSMHSKVGYICIDHDSSAVGHICAMSQVYLSRAYASYEKCMYICVSWSHC